MTRQRDAQPDPAMCVDKWNRRIPMTHCELALVMGLSRNGVADIERRALAKIRDALIQTRALERKVGV